MLYWTCFICDIGGNLQQQDNVGNRSCMFNNVRREILNHEQWTWKHENLMENSSRSVLPWDIITVFCYYHWQWLENVWFCECGFRESSGLNHSFIKAEYDNLKEKKFGFCSVTQGCLPKKFWFSIHVE